MFACKSKIDSSFFQQKKAMRAIMPGYVRYFYKEGTPPSGTKTSFKEYNVLTVHGIIAKSTIMFMAKYHHWPDKIPVCLRNTIDVNAPMYVTNDLEENIVNWYNSHNNTTYRNSLYFKGPLIFSDHLLSELANLRSSLDNLKSKT